MLIDNSTSSAEPLISENPLRVPNGALRFRLPAIPVDRKLTQVWVMDQAEQVR